MNLSRFFRVSFFSIFSCLSAWSADVVMLRPENAQLKGAKLKNHEGRPAIYCFHTKGFEAKWNVDIPKAGTYIVELEFGCPGPNSGHPFEFRIGKASFVWTSFETKGWWEYKRRHIQKVKLEKGIQSLSVTPLESKGINISHIRLISSPGFVVAPALDGSLALKPELSDLTESSLYPNNILCSYGETAGWNLSLPESGKYKIFISYASPAGGTVAFKSPSGNLSTPLPATGKWENFEERAAGEISLPAGESSLVLKRPNGVMDIKEVRLLNAAAAEKAVVELRDRPRLGMSLNELEMIWGVSQAGNEAPTIDRKGGKEDVDWELYKEAASYLKSRIWQKPGMKITAYLLNDRCLGLNVNLDVKELKASCEAATILMPGVEFKWNPQLMTIYSEDRKYKFQYWGSYFELKDSGLLRSLKEKGGIAASQSVEQPFIGKRFAELQKIMGEGRVLSGSLIDRRGDQNDQDWMLYRTIRPAIMPHQWILPNKGNIVIIASFLQDKCIALSVRKREAFSPQELTDTVRELLPGVTFPPISSIPSSTVYSTNFENGYKLQNWGSYFEIKASGMIRQMLKDREIRLKESVSRLINLLKASEVLKKKSLFGQTRQELDSILGMSSESRIEYCVRPTCVWKFPDCDLEIYGSFEKSKRGLVCSHITIADNLRQLPLDMALSVARQLIAPYTLENIDSEEMRSWFSVKSQERGNRFLLEWYHDPDSRASLRITDNTLAREKERAAERKKGLDDIRKQL